MVSLTVDWAEFCQGIPVWERRYICVIKAEKMGRNRGQGIIIGFLVFVIAVISICTIIFRSYVREFHKSNRKGKI